MNFSSVSHELRPAVEDLMRRFEGRVDSVYTPHLNEIYVHAGTDVVSVFCAHLYRRW